MNDPHDEFTPYWLRTAMPAPNGGILGKLEEPAANGGLLGRLAEPAPEPWNERPVLPMTPQNLFTLAFGGLSAQPDRPLAASWNDPRLGTHGQTPSAPMTSSLPLPPTPTFPAALPLEHLASSRYWPTAPAPSGGNEEPLARSGARMPSHAADSADRRFSAPPTPASMPGTNPAGYSRADEAALAQHAYDASAKRLQRGVRGRATAPYEPPARDLEADAGEPGVVERIRLNGVDSFYRGTLMGAGRLALMQHHASTPDEPGIDPQTKRWRDQLRKDYPGVLADLARYDRMRRFENPLEFGAAALGQLGGGLPTPESLVGVGAKGATWLARAAKAGLQQGAVNAATDPVVQALNMRAGVQEEYDPWRPAIAGGIGALFGSGVRLGTEAIRAALAHRRRSGAATGTGPSPTTAEPQPRATVADDPQAATPSAPEPRGALAPQGEVTASGSISAPATLHRYLFDHSRSHEVPPVEQRNLAHLQPARGVPEYVQALDTRENMTA